MEHSDLDAKTDIIPKSIEINQNILREKIEKIAPPINEFFKMPYLVWTGMPSEFTNNKNLAEQESIPEILRQLGSADGTIYSADELNKKYINGGLIIQPDGKGKLEAYPVKIEDIERNTKLSSKDEACRLNPQLAKISSQNPEIVKIMEEEPIIGMMRSAPAKMIKMSDIGYSKDIEVILPGKGKAQKKTAGEDAYLGIGINKKEQNVFWIINCDENGLPVNYLKPEDILLETGSIQDTIKQKLDKTVSV